MKKVVSLLLVGILLFSSVKPAGANFVDFILTEYRASLARIIKQQFDDVNRSLLKYVLRYAIFSAQMHT